MTNEAAHPDSPLRAAGSIPARDLLLLALPLLALVPFAATAFRVDDPMYIWAARHIQAHPFDPYGFQVNWHGSLEPMAAVMKNPPVVCYFMAAVATLVGWSETALHLAFLLPAYLAALGIYKLAARLCSNPIVATLAACCSPVFLVSSLTVMSDILMLMFFVWAVYCWTRGLERDDHRWLALASLLMPLAALTKYFGLALIPLLLAYSLIHTRRAGAWLAHFVLPVAALAAYQWGTAQLYGRGLLLDAVSYASNFSLHGYVNAVPRYLAIFSFLGGCLAAVGFFAVQLWPRKALLAGVAAMPAVYLLIVLTLKGYPWVMDDGETFELISAQFAVWIVVGASLLALSVLDLLEHRDSAAALLFLWVLGTTAFAGYFNWVTNSRAILPLVVPAGILIVRRLERGFSAALDVKSGATERTGSAVLRASAAPLALTLTLSLLVVWADSAIAGAARDGAYQIMSSYSRPGRTVWFRGHWGFQYYMEQVGARAQDIERPAPFGAQDVLAIPTINADRGDIAPPAWARIQEVLAVRSSRGISTMGYGGGFYSDIYGPVPFAFGPVPAEEFAIITVRPELIERK